MRFPFGLDYLSTFLCKDRCHFKRVKHLVLLNIKKSYENYLADILGVGSGDENEGSGFSPKNFFSLIKNSRQDNRGISALKDSENILHSGNLKKANLLNSQF